MYHAVKPGRFGEFLMARVMAKTFISILATYSHGTGWVTLSSTEGPGLIRLTQSARMVVLPPRLVDGISASLVSAA